jgi:type IV pilus assembly protein PilV
MARIAQRSSGGFSLVEILVTLVIIVIGLLGLLGVQLRSHQAELESYQRAQALVLVADMADRLNANRKNARCYAITDQNNLTSATGAPFVGGGGAAPAPCAVGLGGTLDTIANNDLAAWNDLLNGVSEQEGGTKLAAMIGARGCVTRDPATETYQISVAWQGLIATAAPTAADASLTCAMNLYGNENLRRVVSTRVRIANLK